MSGWRASLVCLCGFPCWSEADRLRHEAAERKAAQYLDGHIPPFVPVR